ncbi:MAG TPA: DUF1802 family protein [Cytophagaceae bacterium]|jgi:hypothetical protein|nr:DUF1802 family protein [Cytophagaceae bacterium]
MALAFKEWSYVVDALGKGKQSIILRKGGIAEEEGEFMIRGNKFLLFPTLFHQAKDQIKESWLPFLDGEKFYSEDGKVSIDFFVELAEKKLITDWNVIRKLSSYHAWKESVVQERFERWDKNVHLLIVQVYKLKEPLIIDMLPEYGGCKSWVELPDVILEGKAVMNKTII